MLNRELVDEILERSNVDYELTTLDGEDFLIISSGNDSLDLAVSMARQEGYRVDDFDDIIKPLAKDWGFDDEYTTCSNCYCAIGLIPGYYGDIKKYWSTDGAIYCESCVLSDFEEEYVEELTNNPKKANKILTEETLENYGFSKLDEIFETGLREGWTDEPEEVLKKYQDKYDVIFNIYNVDQFGTQWQIWLKSK